MAHVQAAAAMEAAHEQQLASHSGLLDSALDVTATVEARFGLQTNPSLILSTFIVTVVVLLALLLAQLGYGTYWRVIATRRLAAYSGVSKVDDDTPLNFGNVRRKPKPRRREPSGRKVSCRETESDQPRLTSRAASPLARRPSPLLR